jgi:hypothetical protein
VSLIDAHDYPLFELSVVVEIESSVSETDVVGGGEIDSFFLQILATCAGYSQQQDVEASTKIESFLLQILVSESLHTPYSC